MFFPLPAPDTLPPLLSSGLALLPILWLIFSLTRLRLAAYKACSSALCLSLLLAAFVWRMPLEQTLRAALEGAVLALIPIIWVIFAAFYTYNIALDTGAMERIKSFMSSLSGDRRIQALIIAWGFGGFLEAVAGFGTAVAIPASILIALGYEPFFAATLCLLANTIAVAFAVVGIPVTTLAKITDLPASLLALDITYQLAPFIVIVPFILVYTVTKSWSGLKGVILTTTVAGVSFGVIQYLVARFIGPELPAVLGSVVSFAAVAACAKLSPPAAEWHFPHERQQSASRPVPDAGTFKDQCIAWSPYILLLILVLLTSKLVPPVNSLLSQGNSYLPIYHGPGGKPLAVEWLLTPGTLILVCAIVGGLIQGASLGRMLALFGQTLLSLRKTALTIVAIVSMAKVLGYSGMVAAIAVSLAAATGTFYPFFAPMVGALGTFVTGSDTSANVLFGLLQKQTAQQIGANPVWIAAANTSGACAGKLISPQSIAIAATATGLIGKEGDLLLVTFRYLIPFIIGIGILTYLFAF